MLTERSRSGCGLVRACHRRAAQLRRRLRRRRIRRRGPVDHAAEAAQAGLRDPPQHQIVGRGPGVASGLAGRFLAGKAQCALLVAVIDVPDPGDRGAAAADLGGEIAAHPVGGLRLRGTRSTGCEASIRCPARRPSGRTPAAAGRRSIRRRPWPPLAGHREGAAGGAAAGAAAKAARHRQQHMRQMPHGMQSGQPGTGLRRCPSSPRAISLKCINV